MPTEHCIFIPLKQTFSNHLPQAVTASPLFCCLDMNIGTTPMVDSNVKISWVLHLLQLSWKKQPYAGALHEATIRPPGRERTFLKTQLSSLAKAAWQIKGTALIPCLCWLGLPHYLSNQFHLCWRDRTSPQDQMAEAESYPWDTNEARPRTRPARNPASWRGLVLPSGHRAARYSSLTFSFRVSMLQTAPLHH